MQTMGIRKMAVESRHHNDVPNQTLTDADNNGFENIIELIDTIYRYAK